MSFFSFDSWLKNPRSSLHGTRRNKSRSAGRTGRSKRLNLESLEDRVVPSGFNVFLARSNLTSIQSVATAQSVLTTSPEQIATFTGSPSVINYVGAAGDGHFGNDLPFPGDAIGNEVNYFALQATASVVIPSAGNWTFGVNSDDGAKLTVGSFSLERDGIFPPTDTIATFNFPSAGTYPLSLIYYQNSGGDEVELFAAQGSQSSFNSNFHLVGDTANGGLAIASNSSSTTVTSSQSSAVFGQTVTFGATVSNTTTGSSLVPAGTVQFDIDNVAYGAPVPLDGSGHASITDSQLPVTGSPHSITASYVNSDGNFTNSNGSLAGGQSITPAATSTALSAPTVTYNANGTVTVTIGSTAGTPGGNVSLAVNGGTPATQPLSAGSAIFTLSQPNAGSYSLSASYAAQGNFAASTATGTLNVNAAATSVSISAPQVTYNNNGTVIVSVSAAAGVPTPTGSITLTVDGTQYPAQNLSGGQTTFTVTSPSAGTHSLSASYNPSSNYLASSATASLPVLAAPTTTAIDASQITYNETSNVTVTVSAAAGVPTPGGSVTLQLDNGQTQSATLDTNGQATFQITGPDAGNHTLTASYAAQGNYAMSASTVTVYANQSPTTVAISAPQVTYNADGIVTVAVSSNDGTPAGNVSLTVDGTTTYSAPLSGGQAQFTLPSPSAGDHSLSASYAAQGDFAGSTGGASLHVDQAATSVGISAPTVTYNSDGTVTVTVGSTSGTPGGDVSLSVDGGAAQTAPLSGGSATFTIPSPDAGTYSLHAEYAAQGNFAGSSADASLVVNEAATSVAISAPDVTYNADGLITVTVSPQQAGVPTPVGDVTLRVNSITLDGQNQGKGKKVALPKFQPVTLDGNGQATFTLSSPEAGAYSFTVSYAAQGDYAGSSADGTLQIDQAGSTTAVTLGSEFVDGSVTYDGSPHGATASWASTGLDGAGDSLPVYYVGIDGTSYDSSTTAPADAGNYEASASYAGDSDHTGSSNFADFTIAQAASSVSTTVDDAGSGTAWSGAEITGASAYDTVVVTGVSGFAPTGTVTYEFYANATPSGTPVSTPMVTLSGGIVPSSPITGALATGSYSYVAVYSGDSNYTGSTSAVEPFTVLDAPLTAGTVNATGGVEYTTPTSLTATFTDANPNAPSSEFSGTINWGDGNSATNFDSNDVTANGNGSFIVNASYQYAEESGATPYTITVTIDDMDGSSTTDTGSTTVAAPLTAGALTPPLAIEGQPFSSVTVFHFTDADPTAMASDFTATVNTGDATLTSTANPSNVQIVADGDGFDVQLSYTYAEPIGDGNFSVTVTDAGGFTVNAATTSNFAVTLVRANGNVGQIGDVPTAETLLNTPSQQAAVFTDSPPVINYLGAGSGGDFGGDLVFPGESSTSQEVDLFAVEATANVVIPAAGNWTFGTNSDDGVRLTVGSQALEQEGTFPPTDTIATFYFPSAGIYPLDLIYYQNFGGAEIEVFAAQGSFTSFNSNFQLVGDTADGGLSTGFQVAYPPPTAGTVSASGGVAGVTPTTLSATFTDTDVTAPTSEFSGTINWGDGNAATPFASADVTANGNGSFTVNASYQYAGASGATPYNITVTINDNGGSTTDTGTTTVLAAPTLSSTPSATLVALHGTGAPTLTDTASLSGGYNETGTITFTLYDPNGNVVDTEYVTTVNGDGSYTTPAGYTLPTNVTVTGTYQWDASYGGDKYDSPASDLNDPAEQARVSAANPILTTAPVSAAVTLGATTTTLKDTATLTNGYFPTGTVTFYLFAPGVTPAGDYSNAVYSETDPVSGGMASTATGYTLPTNVTVTGTYHWFATYSGDGNNNTVQVEDPTAYYRLNETSGTTADDSSGNGRNGTYQGGYTLGVPGPLPGLTAVSLDGTSGNVSVPASTVNNLSSGTIAAWVYLNDNTGETIFAKQNNGVNSYAIFTIGYDNAGGGGGTPGTLYFQADNQSGFAASTGTVSTGAWYYVAVVFSSTSATFYIDGVASGTTSGNYSIPEDLGPTSTTIGAWLGDGGGQYLNGSVAQFAVFGTALSASQIAAQYSAGGSGGFSVSPGPQLVNLGSFDNYNNGVLSFGSGLLEDSNGNLFGTAGNGGASGVGTVFEVMAGSGIVTPLASFDGADGAYPYSNVVEDSQGDLFGTTLYGGDIGVGAVFEVVAGSGQITLLGSFADSNTASYPVGGLVMDGNGNLYGAAGGGDYGDGTVYEVPYDANTNTYGAITPLASFDGSNGYNPYGNGLVIDRSGNLFGTTNQGGDYGYGTVFDVVANSGTITPLGSFDYSNTGGNPGAGLVEDSSGDLFGTTSQGGANGLGTVFEVPYDANSNTYGAITPLASFDGTSGAGSYLAGVVVDSSGNVYGVSNNGANGYGEVFEVAAGSGVITPLVSFANSNAGGNPAGGLIEDSSGNLFGTTTSGGADGFGTVFELVPSTAESVPVSPASPTVAVSSGQTAALLGTTSTLTASAVLAGGYYESGTITFTLHDPSGNLVDTETAAVTGNGTYTTPMGYALPSTAPTGVYQWDASYSSDGNNNPASDLTDPNAQVGVFTATTATATIVSVIGDLGGQVASLPSPLGTELATDLLNASVAAAQGNVPAVNSALASFDSTALSALTTPGSALNLTSAETLLDAATALDYTVNGIPLATPDVQQAEQTDFRFIRPMRTLSDAGHRF